MEVKFCADGRKFVTYSILSLPCEAALITIHRWE